MKNLKRHDGTIDSMLAAAVDWNPSFKISVERAMVSGVPGRYEVVAASLTSHGKVFELSEQTGTKPTIDDVDSCKRRILGNILEGMRLGKWAP